MTDGSEQTPLPEWIRSTTDPVSNFSFIASIDLTRDLRSILTGILPGQAIPTFLHEAMHHWGFTSAVGTGLALLQLRARTAAYKLHKVSANRHRAVLKIKRVNQKARDLLQPHDERLLVRSVAANLLRYDLANNALAPLVEGIALISEFDTFNQDGSETTTMPLWWAQLFTLGDVPASIRSRAFLAELTSARLGENFIKRKLDLFSQPLASASGPYLIGYLCLRRVWKQCAVADARFKDPEVFLTYTSFMIFGDLELTRILLDPSIPVYQVAGRALRRMHERLTNLPTDLENKWSHLIDERSRHASLARDQKTQSVKEQLLKEMNAPPEVTDIDALRFNTRHEAIQGSLAISAALKELTTVNDFTADEVIAFLNSRTIKGRELLRIGSAEADLRSDGKCITIYDMHGSEYRMAATSGTVAFDRRSGRIELLISMARNFRVLVAFVDQNVVGTTFWGKVPAAQIEALLSDARSQRDLAQYEVGMRQWTSQIVQDEELDVTIRRARQRLWRIADRVFHELTFPSHLQSTPWERMQKAGIFEFLEYDEDLLEALALTSLGCSTRLNPVSIRQLVTDRLGHASDLFSRLAEIMCSLDLECNLTDHEHPTCDI